MTLWFVLGTAAELIKVVPLIRGAGARGWRWRVVSTGQSGQNFWRQYDDFKLPRDHGLGVLQSGEDLSTSGQALKWFLKALIASPADLKATATQGGNWVVVHGDTLSTLVGAVWGKRLGWPVAHVEAGLRSTRIFQPFPEEICRRLVSRLANLHFAPDQRAFANLKSVGVRGTVIDTRGNSLLDAVRGEGAALPVHRERPLCLANLHRYENLNSTTRFTAMVDTLLAAAERYEVVLVMHPPTEHKLSNEPEAKARLLAAGVQLRPRMMFSEFLALVKESEFLISDGGSNQEECFYLGKPCLILRETTERQEGLGRNAVLARFDRQTIQEFLASPQRYSYPAHDQGVSPTAIMLDALAAPRP